MVQAHGFEHIDIDWMSSLGISLPKIQITYTRDVHEAEESKEVLNIIDSYVCVTMPSTSLSSYVHYVDNLDLFELGKNKLFSKFKESKVLEENLSEKKINILRIIIVKQCINVQLQKLVSIQ